MSKPMWVGVAMVHMLSWSLVPAAGAAEYEIVNYPALQDGITVGGTLQVNNFNDDTLLTASELTSWTLTVGASTATSSDAHAGKLLSNVSIGGGLIFLEDPRISGAASQFILAIQFEEFVNYFNGPFSTELNEQVYNGRSGPVPSPSWTASSLPVSADLPMPSPDGRIVIARLVPEPRGLGLMALALLGCVRRPLSAKSQRLGDP